METLVELLKQDISGELGFILGTEIIHENGNIGIPSTLIPVLYHAAQSLFLNGTNDEKLDASMVLVCIHPDHYTALNYRKKAVLDYKRELELTTFILTKHLNKPSLWSHLSYFSKQINTFSLDICDFAGERYACNYPCWSYRRQIISSQPELLHQEWIKNKEFVKFHVSDCSGWSFRSWLLLQLQLDTIDKEEEVEWIQRLIVLYPNHESMWNYYRFLCRLLKVNVSSFLHSLGRAHGKYPYITFRYLSRYITLEVISVGLQIQDLPHFLSIASS